MKGVFVAVALLLALVIGAIAYVLSRPEPAPIPRHAIEAVAETSNEPHDVSEPSHSPRETSTTPSTSSKPSDPPATREKPPKREPEPQRGSLSGRVVDAQGAPVAGAIVYRIAVDAPSANSFDESIRVTSDSNGRFKLSVFEDGTVDLGAVHEGYMPAMLRDIAMSAGDDREGLELILGDGAKITGKVVDTAGHGLADIKIVVAPSNVSDLASAGNAVFLPGRSLATRAPIFTTTDEKGEYVARGLVGDSNYQVRPDTGQMLLVPGTEGDEGRNVVAPAEGVDFTMVKSVSVSVKVQDADSGEPVPSFSVILTRQGDRGASSTSTSIANSPDGIVRFERYLVPGKYQLSAEAKGYEASGNQDVELQPSDSPRELFVRLHRHSKPPGGTLAVTLKDEAGEPITRAHAFAMATEDPSSPGRYGSAQAQNGLAEIKDLEAGRYRISIQPQGSFLQPLTVEAEVRAGETTAVDVVVPTGGKVQIDVKDIEGHYLTDVRVQVTDSQGQAVSTLFVSTSATGQTMSRSDGIFFPGRATAGPLPAGIYTMTFWCSGFQSRSETAEVRRGDESSLSVVMEKQ
ncbi:MAG: carboxypeptidase regulatory-like domain-containing protein [Planctomycetes bacterium]|nr:carboxypeptidase regulatory-like domain-containing protein [Planctomycetota bacterium]MBI3845230.1 carboxypeptidase regulatory-like domain-containing protein [Planctomycetota bacterium]